MAKNIKGDVNKFVKESLVKANDARMACGDGRYEKEQSEGGIRAFGADFGMIMAYAATLKDEGLELNHQRLVDCYVESKQALLGNEASIDYHSDSHSREEGKIGCGFIAKALSPENDGGYGSVNSQDVQKLFDAFSQNSSAHLTVLQGEHKEEGVLFVRGGLGFSVNSKNKKGKMFFVVDADRTEKYIEKLTPQLSETLSVTINSEDVKRNYNLQMATTAKLLKADELPHYKVAVDQNGHFVMEELPKKKSSLQNKA